MLENEAEHGLEELDHQLGEKVKMLLGGLVEGRYQDLIQFIMNDDEIKGYETQLAKYDLYHAQQMAFIEQLKDLEATDVVYKFDPDVVDRLVSIDKSNLQ